MANGTAGAREAALYVLARCRRFDAWSQQTIQTAAEKFSLDERDTALCTKLCLDVLQNAALCDYYIGCYSSVPAAKLEPNLLDILRLGVCQLLFMDKIPVSAAVNEAVEQTKRSGSRAAGLVNAVLRRVAENRENLPEIPNIGTAQELSVRFSHPLWLCERMVSELSYDGAHAFFAANNRAPQLTVSVNTRYGDAPSLVERFSSAGVRAHVSELSSVSVCVEDKGSAAALPGFAAGEFFVQDAAAAMSVLCAAPKKGMRVLDACSAPGGKSLLCASLMENDGEILACDLHEKKLRLVEENVERLGFSIIRTAPMDASNRMKRSAGASILSLRTYRAPAWALSAKSRRSAIRTPKRLPVSQQYRSGSRTGLPRASGRAGPFFIPPAPFSMRKTRMLRNDFFATIRTLSARSSGSFCRRNMIRTAFSIAV